MKCRIALLASLFLAACQMDPASTDGGETPLAIHPRMAASLTDSVYRLADRLRLRVWLDDGTLHQEVLAAAGTKSLTCDGIPRGRGYRLEFTGLDAEGKAVWKGSSQGSSPTSGDVSLAMDVDLVLEAATRKSAPVSSLTGDSVDFPTTWRLTCPVGSTCQYASAATPTSWNRFPDSLVLDSAGSWWIRSATASTDEIPASAPLRYDFVGRRLRIQADSASGSYDFPLSLRFAVGGEGTSEVSTDSGRIWMPQSSLKIARPTSVWARATGRHQPTSDTLKCSYAGRKVAAPQLDVATGSYDFPLTLRFTGALPGTTSWYSLDTGRTWTSGTSIVLQTATKLVVCATRPEQPPSDTVAFTYHASQVKPPHLPYPILVTQALEYVPTCSTYAATVQITSDSGAGWKDWTRTTVQELDTNHRYFARAIKANQPTSKSIPVYFGYDQTWGRMRRVPGDSVLSSFWVDTTEVTIQLWRDIMDGRAVDSLEPISSTTWIEAALFCNARSKRMGLDTVYAYTSIDTITGTYLDRVYRPHDLRVDSTRNGFRLPSNAEWFHFARPGLDTVPEYGLWPYAVYFDGIIRPVAKKRPNLWGIYDVLGNVPEWASMYSYNSAPNGFNYNLTAFSLGEGAFADGRRLSYALGDSSVYVANYGGRTDYTSGFRCVRNLR